MILIYWELGLKHSPFQSGEGAFGKVCKGTLKKDGIEVLVAVKMLKDDAFSEQEAEALWKEIALMKKVCHHGNRKYWILIG